MKTILYSGLTANGNYGSTEMGQLPKEEELNDLFSHAKKAGNIIMGRTTYEIFNDGEIFNGFEIVVISEKKSFEGTTQANSPESAINYLQSKGYTEAFIIGGVQLANSFLSNNLVNEIFINIEPYIAEGLNMKPTNGAILNLKLLNHKEIERTGIVQIHYEIN